MGKSNSVRVGDGEGFGEGKREGKDSISGDDENISMLATVSREPQQTALGYQRVSEGLEQKRGANRDQN